LITARFLSRRFGKGIVKRRLYALQGLAVDRIRAYALDTERPHRYTPRPAKSTESQAMTAKRRPARRKTQSFKRAYLPSAKIEARPSPGKGRGIFARQAIRKGEVIERSPILLVPRGHEGPVLAETILGRYMFQTDDGLRYVIALGYASLYNHGDEANAEFFVSNEAIVIKATRAIRRGAEVCLDYGWGPADWEAAGLPVGGN
jgi:SET domain-containing protein